MLVVSKQDIPKEAPRAACYCQHLPQRRIVSLRQPNLLVRPLSLLKISQALILVMISLYMITGLLYLSHQSITSIILFPSRRIYLRDLPAHVADMANDSGYKFSEEYEVCIQIVIVIMTTPSKYNDLII